MQGLAAFLGAIELEDTGPDRYRGGPNAGDPAAPVFGGQLMAQAVVAAARTVPDKQVKSLHTVFARAGDASVPVEIDVDRMHAGRAFASLTVSLHQGDRLCARALVLLDAAEPDLIRHGAAMPTVPAPDATPARGAADWWDLRVVDDVDLADPEAVGPAELQVWSRFPGAPADPATSRALLAWASDGFLIGTAMRPHRGIGQAMAHVSVSTTVLTHTLTFHDAFRASDWLLLSQESPHAGHGRAYGRGHVFEPGGALVASFVQESMIRDLPERRRPAPGERARH